MAGPGTELAVAYVSLVASTKGMRRDVAKELGGIEADAERSGKRAGGRMSGGITGAVAGAGKLAGRALIGGLAGAGLTAGVAFTKGFGRLKAIEEAQAKLRGLGHDAGTVEQVMKNANDAVKGTAFGLGEAATAAASALAAGVEPGQALENHLRLIGDAATIAGTDFNEMGAIFGKVAAGGIIQGEEIAQLSDRGIPILQLLGAELGVTALEAKKMASEGKVSFETFSAAMQKGMGGAALESGKTVQGAFNNLMASLGRIGAGMLKPLYDLLPGFLTWVTGVLKPVEGAATVAAEVVAGSFSKITGAIGAVVSLLTTGDYTAAVRNALNVEEDSGLVRVILGIRDGFLSLRDTLVSTFGPAVTSVFAGMSDGVAATDRLRAAFAAVVASPFGQWVRAAVTELVARLAPAFQTVAGLVTTRLLPAIVDIARVLGPALGAAVAAFARFAAAIMGSPIFRFLAGAALAVVMGFVQGVINAFVGIVRVITGVLDIIAGLLTGDWGRVWEGLKTVVLGAVQAVWGLLNIWLVGRVVGLVGGAVRGIAAAFGGLGGLIRVGIQAAIVVVRGFVTGIAAALSGVGAVLVTVGKAFTVLAAVAAGVWAVIRDAVTSAWATIAPVLSAMASAIVGGMTAAWRGLVDAASSAWATVSGAARTAWTALSTIVTAIVAAVSGPLSTAFRVIGTIAYNAWHLVSVSAQNAWAILRAIYAALFEAVAGIAVRAFTIWRNAAVEAWGAVSAYISRVWSTISGVFTQIVSWVQVRLVAAFTIWRAAATQAWSTVSAAIATAWRAIAAVFATVVSWLTQRLVAAFNTYRTIAVNVWNTVRNTIQAVWSFLLARVFTPIRTWLTATLVAALNTFRTVATNIWNTVRNTITAVWNTLLQRVFTPIRNWLVSVFTTALNNFLGNINRVWTAVRNAIQTAWNTILSRVFQPIRTWLVTTITNALTTFQRAAVAAWNRVRDTMQAVWRQINDRVLTPFKNGLNSLWNWFGSVVDGITRTWETLREKLAAPIRFVVNTIIRDNLVRAWNAVASKVNLQPFDFKGFLRGGWTGPGAKHAPAGIVHADEFVIRKRSRRRFERTHPGALDYINRTGTLPGYQAGGRVNMDARTPSGLRMWAALMRTFIMSKFGVSNIGGYRPSDPYPDHPSGRALDIMVTGAKGDRIAAFLMANHGPANLDYMIWKQRSWRPGGAWKGMADRGSPTQNHMDHIHALFNPGGGNTSALNLDVTPEMLAAAQAGGGGGGIPNPLHAAAMALINAPFNVVKGLIDGITGRFGDTEWVRIAGAAAKLPFEWVQKFLTDKINSVIPATIFGGGDGATDDGAPVASAQAVRKWAPTVRQALGIAGLPQTTAYVEAWLRQIATESGGDPNAVQRVVDINSRRGDPAVGLVQVIGSTFAAYRDKSLPNNRKDPLASLVAGMRYASARYGSRMLSAIGQGRGYSEGGLVEPELFDRGGFLRPGISLVENATGRPERVLTHEQERALMNRGSGAPIVINGIKYDSVPEFAEALNWAMTRAESRSRYAGVR